MKAIDKIIPETRATDLRAFWTLTPEHIYAALHCGNSGLNSQDAELRLAQYGSNSDAEGKSDSLARAVFRRLLEPLSLILLAAGIVSVATGDAVGGSIIVAILAISVGLDTFQEGHARKGRRGAATIGGAEGRGQARAERFARSTSMKSFRATSCASGPATSFPPTPWFSRARRSPPARPPSPASPIRVEKRPGIVTSASPGEAIERAVSRSRRPDRGSHRVGRQYRAGNGPVRRGRVGAGRGPGAFAVPARPA